MKLITTCLLLLFSFSVSAKNFTVSWAIATKMENGTELLPANIVGHRIYDDNKVIDIPVSGTSTSEFITLTVKGEHMIVVTTLHDNGEESAFSEVAIALVPFAPDPPSNVTVTPDLVP